MDKKKLNVLTRIACVFCFIVFIIFLYYAISYLYVYIYWQNDANYKNILSSNIENIEQLKQVHRKYLLEAIFSFIGAISMGFVTYVLVSFLRCINKTGILTAEQIEEAREQQRLQRNNSRAERKRQALEKKKEAIDKKLSAVEKKEE